MRKKRPAAALEDPTLKAMKQIKDGPGDPMHKAMKQIRVIFDEWEKACGEDYSAERHQAKAIFNQLKKIHEQGSAASDEEDAMHKAMTQIQGIFHQMEKERQA